MQFNMYHHYTVDEHLIRSVGCMADIANGGLRNELPLTHELLPQLNDTRLLYVALFLHDIAKGRPEDHSIAGARIARKFCPRLGLTPAETDTVAWLIEYHLLMSEIAQARDIQDPETAKAFADIVQSPQRLALLMILTACDIRAVGPAPGPAGRARCCAPFTTPPSLCSRAATARSAISTASTPPARRSPPPSKNGPPRRWRPISPATTTITGCVPSPSCSLSTPA